MPHAHKHLGHSQGSRLKQVQSVCNQQTQEPADSVNLSFGTCSPTPASFPTCNRHSNSNFNALPVALYKNSSYNTCFTTIK